MSDAAARWRRVEELCHAALEREPRERAAFVAEACAGDDALRQEVDALLAHEQSAERFLGAPVGAVAAQVMSEAVAVSWVGRRIGDYEIVSPLGAGGMGEVYRARDTQLGRDVAIKVLPPAFTADRDRLSRFEREARVLASLNHPHIGAIYGVEHLDGARALVLELVEGETLAERISSVVSGFSRTGAPGPKGSGLRVDEALAFARQIAEALEAAHEKGIVHRDLKPANIKITRGGTVKVLDFGLAKAGVGWAGQAGADPSNSPTFTISGTQEGVLLGTAAYMSPEQARGQAVDKRADIWAFGCVLYEMLTGRMAFPGSTISDHIAAILEREPDWAALPASTPPSIRRLLRRCLDKDSNRRLHDVADARIEIDEALASPVAEPVAVVAAPSRRVAPMAIAAMAGGAVIALVAWTSWTMLRPSPLAPVPSSRFSIAQPPSETLNVYGDGRAFALSPDGRHLVYRAGGSQGGSPLLVRAIDELNARPLPGITGALGPFFSPDSRWIGFFESPVGVVEYLLMKVSITGGPAIAICKIKGSPLGASWSDDNTVVFATNEPGTGLWQVSAGGGTPAALTKPDTATGENHHLFPSVLPGGRRVLFTIATADQDKSQVAVLDRKTGQRRTLVRGGSDAEYLESGHLIYAVASTLRAVRFDPIRLEVLADPVPVVDQVMMTAAGAANYAVSRSGTLIYTPAGSGAQRSLGWVDRKGREELIKAPPRDYLVPRLSPDGTRVVVGIADEGNTDLWIWDLAREQLTRLTVDRARNAMAVWTPDSKRIIFASNRSGYQNLYSIASDGTGAVERLTTSTFNDMATSITPDGTWLLGFENGHGTQQDIVVIPLTTPTKAEMLIQTPFNEVFPSVSADGHYLAYQSNESGRLEIYVRPFPHVERGRWQVSREGGTRAVWAPNGRELFYIDESKTLIAVPVRASESTFSAGTPAKVFDTKYAEPNPARHYDVSADGQRFLMMKDIATPPSFVVVERWFEELKAKVGARQP